MALKTIWKKYQDQSDEKLMQAFRESGNLEELGVLYERYMHLVYGVCLKYFEDRAEAQDGVTAIFEKLIIDLPKHEVGNFKSWLYVLTKNFCLMQIRSKKSTDKKEEKWVQEQDLFVESEETLHPIDEDRNTLDRALKDCIEELKAEQKKCIQLFYYENFSYKEVSEQLKMEEKKVKSYIQNGKRNLKICIEQKNGK